LNLGRPVHVGLIITTIEDRKRNWILSWNEISTMVRLAEQVGFDSVWIPDHLIHEPGDAPKYGIWESWSLIASLAAMTTRIEIGPHVLCASFRNPALIAKMAATVDEICGGRLNLALGAGWHAPEYRAFGFPFDHRVGRFEEAIQIIHGLLRDGKVNFDGRFYQTSDCELRPRGPSKSGPPIMVGTIAGTPLARWLGIEQRGSRMLDIVARYADLWNCPVVNDPALIPKLRQMVDDACAANGRDPSDLGRTNGLMLNLPGWETIASNQAVRERRSAMGAVEGDHDELAELLLRFAAEGVDQVQVQLDPETPAGIEHFGRTLELLDRG
jgi:alkanesulfonate monooxygenase SsuD/methylene tetrahydromethanopterin reductase-like flavin-dependent oxidoreductase (luciferase family)